MDITIKTTAGKKFIYRDGVVVGYAFKWGNGRWGIFNLDDENLGSDSYATLADVRVNYEDVITWIGFGTIARNRLSQQSQYASRMIDGRHGSPNLGDGLRFRGDPADYHDIKIHRDDIETFVGRVLSWRLQNEE